MRIAIISDSYTPNMGYAENILPREMARLGAEVHLITSGLPAYHMSREVTQLYSDFKHMATDKQKAEGVRLHVIPGKVTCGYLRLCGLNRIIRSIRPDIVQTFTVISWTPLLAALGRPFGRYRLYTGNHTTLSAFPRPKRIVSLEGFHYLVTRRVCGRLVSWFSEKSFAATSDCGEVATRFFGVPKKQVEVWPLGVDTDIFSPIASAALRDERERTRVRLGVRADELLCVYTGRFTDIKNPALLARAVAQLAAEGRPWRAVFVGAGPQRDEIERLPNCIVQPFVPFEDLAKYYRAADVGVWPTQESTSMIDCAACGIPIVVNDTIKAVERVHDNGLTYRLNDLADLVSTLKRLESASLRARLGDAGARKMAEQFSWRAIAKRRLAEYERILQLPAR